MDAIVEDVLADLGQIVLITNYMFAVAPLPDGHAGRFAQLVDSPSGEGFQRSDGPVTGYRVSDAVTVVGAGLKPAPTSPPLPVKIMIPCWQLVSNRIELV